MTRTQLPDCHACRYCIVMIPRLWCEAPQLQGLLDMTDGRRGRITDAEGARDFAAACGHKAVWFVKVGAQSDN